MAYPIQKLMENDPIQKEKTKRLKDLVELEKQVNSLSIPNAKNKTLKVGIWSVEFKCEGTNTNGTVTAIFKGKVANEVVKKLTFGGGRGQFDNVFNALQEARIHVAYRIQREIALFKTPIDKLMY